MKNNNFMKRVLFFTLIIFFISNSFAQKRIDYKDIYSTILSGNKEKSYTLLLAFQRQDPEFANTYFQLGLIAHDWAIKFNPFTEFTMMKLFIYNTKLYYNLAKVKLDDEKKRNKEYYLNIKIVDDDKKLTIDDIKAYIDIKTKEIETYEKNIVQIITYYNKSSDSYNECVNIFMNINKQYSKIKNIYLAEDQKFYKNVDLLVSNFDSTLYYFDLYKAALKNFPLEGYYQNYSLKDIYTYRLDGLTYSNFLENEIILWNYKKWVNDVKEIKKNNISTNRSYITEADKSMKTLMTSIESGQYLDEYTPYIPDKKLIYKIEKYDNNSLIVRLIKLNSAKINFLKFYKTSVNDQGIDSLYSLNQYLQFINVLIEMKKTCDSLNTDLINNINDEDVNKYTEFYNGQYNGTEGLKKYAADQQVFFNKKLNDAMKSLSLKLRNDFISKSSAKIVYKNISIDKKQYFPEKELAESDKYYLWDFKKDKKGINTFKGFYKTGNGNLAGFAGQSSDMESFKSFVKTGTADTADIFYSVIAPYEQGFYTIETSIGKKILNKLIQYNKFGKEVLTRNIPIDKVPRYMNYDEINNTLLIVCNGEKLDITTEHSVSEQIICLLDPKEEESKFLIRNPAKAYVFDMLKTENKFMIFSNYSYYTDKDGNKNWSEAGKSAVSTNILATIISEDGIILEQIPIKNKESVLGIKAIKINSNLINILGFQSDFKNDKFNLKKDTKLLYLRFDSEIEPIYIGWHD